MQYQDDAIYIERVLNGDLYAFKVLVTKHKNLVFTIALRILNNREDAEEVAQDTFVKAYHSLRNFERKSKFSTWLYRIAYNASISLIRKKKLEYVAMDESVIHNYTEDSIERSIKFIEDEEKQYLLKEALKQLTEDELLLVNLFYHGNKTVDDIRHITGLSSTNIKVRLHRIRKKLLFKISELNRKKLINN